MAKPCRSWNRLYWEIVKVSFVRFTHQFSMLLLLAAPQALAQAVDLEMPVDQAIDQVKQDTSQSLATAENLLQSVPFDDPDFAWALLELQKLRYRRGDWKKFFGGMVLYRYQVAKQTELPELLILESMALIQHCQFRPSGQALGYLDQMSSQARSSVLVSRSKQILSDLLEFQRLAPGNVVTAAASRNATVFNPMQEWRIEQSARTRVAQSVSDPHALSVYVEDLCAKKDGGMQ